MINAITLQHRLIARGYDLAADGALGPLTYAALFAAVAQRRVGHTERALGRGAADCFSRYSIITPLRLAHFLGQTCVETGGYVFLRELWGPTPTQSRYDGRKDLGNSRPGDGLRYRGRGLIQLTGRANYRAVGERIGLDLEGQPELAERPDIAVLTACDWWQMNDANRWADADDARAVSRLVNRGKAKALLPANHERERIAATARAKEILL